MRASSFFFLSLLMWVGYQLATGCSPSPPRQQAEMPPVFPNANWYAKSEIFKSGVSLRFDPHLNLLSFDTTPIDWSADLAEADGFSPLQPILVFTESGCPTLPQPGDEAASVADDAPLRIIDGSGAIIPWFGEPGEDPTVCEIYPLQGYAPGASVNITIRETFGATLTGVTALPYAWQFPAGTYENRIRDAYRLRDATMQWLGTRNDDLLVEIKEFDAPEGTFKRWIGQYKIPDFTGPDGRLASDENGNPKTFGTATETFYLVAATTITQNTSPAPLVQYGHGLFGDPNEVWGGGQGELRKQVAGVFGAIPWGMAVRYFHRAAAAIVDPNNLGLLRDQVLQGLANQLVFSAALRDELGPFVAAQAGVPVSDIVDYIGISQGGILGSPMLALSPHIRRAVLHVSGGGWTAMMTHSSNWTSQDGFGYGEIVRETVPDPKTRTLVYGVWQSIWDTYDPAVFSKFWLNAPAELDRHQPHPHRQVYYPYSIDDPQVPNFSSETVLRTNRMPLLSPSITNPHDVERATYSNQRRPLLASQWDVGGGQPAHGDVRKLPAFANQVRQFLKTGVVNDVCNGSACKFLDATP